MTRPHTLTGAAGRLRGTLGTAARKPLALLALGAALGLTACGSTTSSGHPGTAELARKADSGVPLCAAARTVERVQVSLIAPLPRSPFRDFLPRGYTITSAFRARALAGALCALPPAPRAEPCPADLGGGVRLTFAAGQRRYPAVRAETTGCRLVTGLGPARTYSQSPAFRRLLDRVASRGRLRPL